MIIEKEKRSDFESRVKEALHIYSFNINPTIYDDEATIEKLADLIGWEYQSPVNDKCRKVEDNDR